jgi:uncharacterized protein YecE (DUF72 family)
VELHVGTSGYSYKEWKGSFYPEDLSAKKMLTYYGERLDAVEINNTFYRLPRASVLENWAEQVPQDFRFSIKASRRITHFTRMKPEAREPTEYLLSTLETLEERLGVILFQLPPNLKKDAERLEGFLAMLPEGTPAAFEFRHDSWKDEEVYDLLRSRGMALVCADTGESGAAGESGESGESGPAGESGESDVGDSGLEAVVPDERIVETGSWGYLRLRRPGYSAEDLARWAAHVRRTSWDRTFVFFKHEDAGAGPRMAEEFRALYEADS